MVKSLADLPSTNLPILITVAILCLEFFSGNHEARVGVPTKNAIRTDFFSFLDFSTLVGAAFALGAFGEKLFAATQFGNCDDRVSSSLRTCWAGVSLEPESAHSP